VELGRYKLGLKRIVSAAPDDRLVLEHLLVYSTYLLTYLLTHSFCCGVVAGYGIPVGHTATAAVTARPSQPQTGRVAPAVTGATPARTYVGFTSPGNLPIYTVVLLNVKANVEDV